MKIQGNSKKRKKNKYETKDIGKYLKLKNWVNF